ncbi:hypothetical protein OM280_23590 [Escherichia albertii]|nr:hypothetical protein [Escherichia albertii]
MNNPVCLDDWLTGFKSLCCTLTVIALLLI